MDIFAWVQRLYSDNFFYHVIYMSNITNFVRKEHMEMTYCWPSQLHNQNFDPNF